MEFQLDRSQLDPETRAQLEVAEATLLKEKQETRPDYNVRILQDWMGRKLTSLHGALEFRSLAPSDEPLSPDAPEVQSVQNDILAVVPNLMDSNGKSYAENFGGDLAANIDPRVLPYVDQLVHEVKTIITQNTSASAQAEGLWQLIERVRQIKTVEQIPVIN